MIDKLDVNEKLNSSSSSLEISRSHSQTVYNYSKELNKSQMSYLDYSYSEYRVVAFNLFMSPEVDEGTPNVVRTISIICSFLGLSFLTLSVFGFIEAGETLSSFFYSCVILYVLIFTALKCALVFINKTIVKVYYMRKRMKNEYHDSKICINQIRYPFLLCVRKLSEDILVPEKYTFKLLSSKYQRNLRQIIPNRIHFTELTKKYLKWRHDISKCLEWDKKDENHYNGLHLLHAMLSYHSTWFTAFHFGILLIMIITIGVFEIAGRCLSNIMDPSFTLYSWGITLMNVFSAVLACFVTVNSTFSANFQYMMAPSPESFFKIEELFFESSSRKFVIDIFDITTLDTYLENYMTVREIMRYSTMQQELPLTYLILLAGIYTAMNYIFISLGVSDDQAYGYGYMTVLMYTLCMPVLLSILLHVYIGSLFNGRPYALKVQLKRVKDIYIRMNEILKMNVDRSLINVRMQFLLDCLGGREFQFEELCAKVDQMMDDIDDEFTNHPFKFLTLMTCSIANITAIMLAIAGSITALSSQYYTTVQSLLAGPKYVS